MNMNCVLVCDFKKETGQLNIKKNLLVDQNQELQLIYLRFKW